MASVFSPVSAAGLFSGAAYEPARDGARLTKQLDCIIAQTADKAWRTIERLTIELRRKYPHVEFPENSVSAQLRNLRKIGYTLERQHVAHGLFEYRVFPPVNLCVGMVQAASPRCTCKDPYEIGSGVRCPVHEMEGSRG